MEFTGEKAQTARFVFCSFTFFPFSFVTQNAFCIGGKISHFLKEGWDGVYR